MSAAVSTPTNIQYFVTLTPGRSPAEVMAGTSGNLVFDNGVHLTDPSGVSDIVNAGPGVTSAGTGTTVGSVPLNLVPLTKVTVTSVAPITLGTGAEVTGNVLTTSQPTEASGAVIDGTLAVSPSVAVTGYTWNVTFPATVSNVTVNAFQSQTLAPGSYGNVTVNGSGTLTLTAGAYTFNALTVGVGANLKVNGAAGPVAVYVQNSLTILASIQIVNNDASKFLLGYAGTANENLLLPFTGTYVAINSKLVLGGTVHTGAFFATSIELQNLGQIAHSPFAGWTSGLIPLQGPQQPPKAPSLAALPPAQAQPPLQTTADLPAFLQWACQSRPSQGHALRDSAKAVAGNEALGAALVSTLNAETDLGQSLVEISILGQMKTHAGFQYFTSLLNTPVPTTGTFVSELGMPLEAVQLVEQQARAVDGVAMMLTPQADALLLQVIGSSQTDVMVLSRAVHDFLFVHGPYARPTLAAALPANAQILLDQIDVVGNGQSYNQRLANYLALHPEVVPPPVN